MQETIYVVKVSASFSVYVCVCVCVCVNISVAVDLFSALDVVHLLLICL